MYSRWLTALTFSDSSDLLRHSRCLVALCDLKWTLLIYFGLYSDLCKGDGPSRSPLIRPHWCRVLKLRNVVRVIIAVSESLKGTAVRWACGSQAFLLLNQQEIEVQSSRGAVPFQGSFELVYGGHREKQPLSLPRRTGRSPVGQLQCDTF